MKKIDGQLAVLHNLNFAIGVVAQDADLNVRELQLMERINGS